VGKSDVACELAKLLDAEIISADSMAVYKFMDVGTAKPLECMREIKHHLVSELLPSERFDAKLFQERALELINELTARGKLPLVVGGTYMYLQALIYGLDPTPPPSWRLREALYGLAGKLGKERLYRTLKALDPAYAEKIHPNDLRRVVRALEVLLLTGRPFSSFHSWSKPKLEHFGVFLTRERDELYRRIEERLKKMLKNGLMDELDRLLKMGYERFLVSGQAIGYKEFVPCAKGRKRLEECLKEAVKNTKEQARRQIRWFRRQGWLELNLSELSVKEAAVKIAEAYEAELAHTRGPADRLNLGEKLKGGVSRGEAGEARAAEQDAHARRD